MSPWQLSSTGKPNLRCIPALEKSIQDIDGVYDSCNDAYAQGEADKFRSAKFLF